MGQVQGPRQGDMYSQARAVRERLREAIQKKNLLTFGFFQTALTPPPLYFWSMGGWRKLAVAEIRKLAAALARQTGQEEKEAQSHLFQRLGVLLVRGNCALFVNRKPDNLTAEIDGVE